MSTPLQDSRTAPNLTRVDASDQSAVADLAGSFDVVVDATGSPQGLASASELCRPLGWVEVEGGGWGWGWGVIQRAT